MKYYTNFEFFLFGIRDKRRKIMIFVNEEEPTITYFSFVEYDDYGHIINEFNLTENELIWVLNFDADHINVFNSETSLKIYRNYNSKIIKLSKIKGQIVYNFYISHFDFKKLKEWRDYIIEQAKLLSDTIKGDDIQMKEKVILNYIKPTCNVSRVNFSDVVDTRMLEI